MENMQRLKLLLNILSSSDARRDEIDDALMDLGEFDEPEAENALSKFVTNKGMDSLFVSSAASSLAEIWHRKKSVNKVLFDQMTQMAKAEVLGFFETTDPQVARALKNDH